MTTKNLLVELFVEELPPKALKKLGDAFANGIFEGLERRDFLEPNSEVTVFASPRRLAAHISYVRGVSQPRPMPPKTLMPVSVGLDIDGKPTAPLLKVLKTKLGYDADVDVEWLMRERIFVEDEAGKSVLKHDGGLAAGSALAIGLEGALDESLTSLPIPKVMTYQLADGWSDVKFVRPAHGLVALHGADVVAIEALGLKAGNTTHGHRFEALVDPVVLQHADSYAATLAKDGAVIASFAVRRAEIVRQLAAAASNIGGGVTAIDDDALLDEVTALVERPNVLVCEFEKEFLDVPQECLILTMKANQKYFPLLDANAKLTNKFLVVSNISPKDASFVIGGNERVVRPRLADAKFFFDQDRKKTLASRVEGLGKVVYHNKLGSQGERVERVRAIARWIAARVGADVDLADRAGLLSKADLVTDMVGEFPELQGIMGSYYARHDGEDEQVAIAIADQYLLKGSHEHANNLVSVCLTIADRVETLVGIWGIGLKPSGEKDPFALRRHALTIISYFELLDLSSFIGEEQLSLELTSLLNFAATSFNPIELASGTVDEVGKFIYERYWNQLAPLFGAEVVEAVISQYPPLQQVTKRVQAVRGFKKLPEAPALAAANKRISNILKKAEGVTATVDESLLQEAAEVALHKAMNEVVPKADAQFKSGDYTASLQTLAALRAPVDAFFESVMVNADDLQVRANRLGLLATLHVAMNRVADLSKLAT